MFKTAHELGHALLELPPGTVLSMHEDHPSSTGYRLSVGVSFDFVEAPPEGAMTEVPTATLRLVPDGNDVWDENPSPPKEHDAGRTRVRSGNYHGA